jgi:hypothetical protein
MFTFSLNILNFVISGLTIWMSIPELQHSLIRHNGAKKKLQLKHKNSLFTLQAFHYNYY